MKIKVWTMTTDTEYGLQTRLFTTEPERDKAVFDWLSRNKVGDNCTGADIAREFNGDMTLAGEKYQNGEDFLNFDDHEIEVTASKIKVWAVAATSDGEMSINTYPTETEADNAAWGIVEEGWSERAPEETFEEFNAEHDNNLNSAWTDGLNYDHDTLHVEPIEVEVPTSKNTIYTITQESFDDDVATTTCYGTMTQRDADLWHKVAKFGFNDEIDGAALKAKYNGVFDLAFEAMENDFYLAWDQQTVEMPQLQVTVEVTGGNAHVTQCPEGVAVEIVDHDNERNG